MAGAQLPRPIAAQDDQSDFTLRSYQQEMLEASTMRNVIVAMDTGSGKTHVAIARMLAELERCDASQVSIVGLFALDPHTIPYSAIGIHHRP